jgi:phosphatidylserine/phosphatidylglycerophosphate/cardiolipin synthase-like enzyme
MRKDALQIVKTAVGGGIVLTALAALLVVFQLQQAPSEAPAAAPLPPQEIAIETFFTQPGEPVQDPELALLAAINGAEDRVDVAIYSFNLWSVRDALLEAKARGLDVRMVVEGDNLNDPEVQALVAAGIPVAGDRSPGLMHHKFVVVDGDEVWTGSMNLSYGSVYQDHNNLVHLATTQAAQSFEREFDEMFAEGRFGPASLSDTPYPQVSVNAIPVEILFSPDDGVAARVLSQVRQAEETIEVMAYAFTSDALADLLIEKAQSGVEVRVVMEGGQASASGSEAERLAQADLGFRLESSPALMHHKVIIIDARTVLTGSYNFTRSAETRNDEAMLMIHDSAVAQSYLEEFESIYQAATAG